MIGTHMQRRRVLAVFLLTMTLLAHATAATAQTLVDAVSERGIVPAGRNEAGMFDNNPAIPGESMTTGLAIDQPYIPILVNIDNVAGSWPQWGIAQADIIYEMPIYAHSLTRLMALFAYDHPEQVGPLRSGRVMHAEMRQEWGSAWAFAGIQSMTGSNVNQALRQMGARDGEVDLILNVLGGQWSSLYHNIKHHVSPHNHSLHLAQAAQVVAGAVFPARPFLFADGRPAEGEPATSIDLLYSRGSEDSYTNSSYSYNPETNLYARTRDGKPYADMNNEGVALTFSNVIIQWTELTFNQGKNNAPLVKLVGEGNADFFMGGRHITGYWVRTDENSRTVFFDSDGNEIRIQRGKSWINITSPTSTVVRYSK